MDKTRADVLSRILICVTGLKRREGHEMDIAMEKRKEEEEGVPVVVERMLEGAYVTEGERPVVECWHMMEEEDRALVCQLVRYAGDKKKAREAMGKKKEWLKWRMKTRPWIGRAVEYYQRVGVEALNRVVLQQYVTEGLLDTVPGTLKGERTSEETKRKQLRDLMEAGGYYPRLGGVVVASQVNVQVEVPEWKKG